MNARIVNEQGIGKIGRRAIWEEDMRNRRKLEIEETRLIYFTVITLYFMLISWIS